MAFSAHAELVAAVVRAGGLGLIGVGYNTKFDFISSQLDQAIILSGTGSSAGALGVGFITWKLVEADPDGSLIIEPLLERREIRALWFSFGDFKRYLPKIRKKRRDIVILSQVQTVAEAVEHLKEGGGWEVDVVVAQGSEAGGHGARASNSTFCLVPQLSATLSTLGFPSRLQSKRPCLLAAGGITTPSQLAAALLMGAHGVVLGTVLSATEESALRDEAKQRLLSVQDGGLETVRTEVFDRMRGFPWPETYNGRVLRNLITKDVDAARAAGRDGERELEAWSRQYTKEVEKGNFNVGVVFAGGGAGMLGRTVRSAEDVVRDLVGGAVQVLQGAGTWGAEKSTIAKI
ncbi:NPD-domain-containing protein [Gonapodya prolifera JEL478]|uniref:NPD-domain-containing protein n=1 Tax=Gonapodya prolifera (strain JEL478) TaxID=1344416 RepID=A0A139AU31_GONPJ|nr:NPD-domain-containing protein [Gonapodya prolifera JEL478]|eukprot:KXS20242.1 NPD-domain-containing protein [Gonapodya prolifera JEL478]